MAEHAIEPLFSLVVSVVRWFYRTAARVHRLKADMDAFHHKLEELRRHLRAAERVKHRDPAIASWVTGVREKARDLEDDVDNYSYAVRGGGQLFTLIEIANKLKGMESEIQKICAVPQEVLLQLQHEPSVAWAPGGSSSRHRAHEYAGMDSMEPEATEEHERNLESWLSTEPHPAAHGGNLDARWMAIAVWGMPGVGKTTLASRVYHKHNVRKKFDCRAWVCVSETRDALGMLKALLRQLLKETGAGDGYSNNLDKGNLIKRIRARLTAARRYLVVFDDVWSEDFWVEISPMFPRYAPGCRILLTTRTTNVARSLALDSRILELKPLEEEKALALFHKKAFWRYHGRCPQSLQFWARKIVDKCAGLPLAIVVTASLMALADTTPAAWERFCNALPHEFHRHDSIRNVIMLSFHHLPYYQRMCFLYCSMFPEDRPIGRKQLIRLWVAERFVEPREGIELEDVAEGYLEDLAQRSMIQVLERNETGRIRACRLHDVVRDVAMKIAREEKLSATSRGSTNPGDASSLLTRSLSVHEQFEEIPHGDPFRLRSLLVFARDDRSAARLQSLSSLRLLKVLELRGVPITKVPDVVFTLYNLCYLGLRDTMVEYQVFPEKIAKLVCLQKLDLLGTRVRGLPHRLGSLQELRHLMICDSGNTPRFPSYCALPGSVGNLTNLQTLKSFRASNPKEDYLALKELTQLRTLSINEVRTTDGLALCDALARMDGLQRLKVKSVKGHYIELNYLKPPPRHLKKLMLDGQLKSVPNWSVPNWFKSLVRLTHLYLFDSKIHWEVKSPLEYLECLPSLVLLCLDNAWDGSVIVFRKQRFQCLRTLYLKEMPFLSSIEIEKGALPALALLSVYKCRMIKRNVPKVEDLPSLQELVVEGCGEDMGQVLRQICQHLSKVQLRVRD